MRTIGRYRLPREMYVPVAWILLRLWLSGVIPAALKGSYSGPYGPGLILASASGLAALIAFLMQGRATHSAGYIAIVVLGAFGAATARFAFGTPAYEAALYNFSIFLFALLVVVGEVAIGLSGGIIIIAAGVASVVDTGILDFVALAYVSAVLTLALVWVLSLRKIAGREHDFRARAEAQVASRKDAARALAAMRLDNAFASSGARRALVHIAEAEELDEETLASAVQAEAALRDHLRSPGLNHPLVAVEVASARRRGTHVRLLGLEADERGDHGITTLLAARISQEVRAASAATTVTVRQQSDGVSIVIADGAGHTTHHRYDSSGHQQPVR